MNFDDSGASPLGSLEGVWPLVFAKRESDCQRASISAMLVAALRAAP